MKFIAMIVGGIGPDVWDRDLEIDGSDFADAAQQAHEKAEEMGGRVLTMEEPSSAEEVCRQRVASELDVQELRDVKEYLWPNQTGLPNEYRSALIAIQARERGLAKDNQRLEFLVKNSGSFANDSFQTITISGDDATRSWHVHIGKKWVGYGSTIRGAIDKAIEGMGNEEVGS